MDLILTRKQFRADGIFSVLSDVDGNFVAEVLEHAYQQVDGSWRPKVYDGEFLCVRGQHRLASMSVSFETFEVTGVIGHSNILFHVGNYDKDSEGCLLLGRGLGSSGLGQIVTASRLTFEAFMALQSGIHSFNLTVRST